MWRNHIPKLNITFPTEVLVSSDGTPYRNLTFHNILARQSSYCNWARLKFQAFALRNMKMTAREGCRAGQKMGYGFSFANLTVLALEETFISMWANVFGL